MAMVNSYILYRKAMKIIKMINLVLILFIFKFNFLKLALANQNLF